MKSGAALSLSSLLEEDKASSADTAAAVGSDSIPDDERILSCWNSIPDEYSSRPRLASTIKAARVGIESEDGCKVLTFKVSNESQEKWIRENQLRSLESLLQSKLGSSRLRLQVGVVPLEENSRKVYTDQEKATALMGENNELQNLVKDFGLETK